MINPYFLTKMLNLYKILFYFILFVIISIFDKWALTLGISVQIGSWIYVSEEKVYNFFNLMDFMN